MFGQFSEAHTARQRATVADKKNFAHCIGKFEIQSDVVHVKNMGHNRSLVTFKNGAQAYVLHSTAVVIKRPNGQITLQDGGWQTRITRRAMMEGLSLFGVIFNSLSGSEAKLKGTAYHHLLRFSDKEIKFSCPFTFNLKAIA